MKKLTLLLMMLSIGLPAAAADSASYWEAGDLAGYDAKLGSKVDADGLATESLGEFGSHFALMVHRSKTGTSESHDNDTDFYVVQSGQATLYVGGEIVDAKQTAPGEIRGSSIKGGKKLTLKPGDTINIPPKTPHHVVLAPGEKITYLIVKIHR